MADNKHDGYQEGLHGSQFTGSTVEDSLDYARGKSTREGGQGGGMLVAFVVLSPLICVAYPFVGLATVGTAFLVTRGAPLVGIKSGSGVLIVVALVAIVAAFLGGLAVERGVSKSKAYRAVRWIMRLLLIPGMVVFTLVSRGTEGISIERVVVLLIVMAVGCWFLKGLDRLIGATGEG
jgi:cbb3-type cytochrome oxidase subunit 1